VRSHDFFVVAAKQVKFTPCVLAAIISVLCVANAKASPVTYTESATVNGTLTPVGGPVITFAGAHLIVTGTGNTSNISGSSFITNPLSTVTFIVGGAGAGTFTDAFQVFDAQGTT